MILDSLGGSNEITRVLINERERRSSQRRNVITEAAVTVTHNHKFRNTGDLVESKDAK